jgi:uncharacterized membrane protein (DUF373 family)
VSQIGDDEGVVADTASSDAGSLASSPSTSDAHTEDWWSRTSSALTERAQDLVSSLVAACLIVLAAVILIAAIVDFYPSTHHGLTVAATDFLDKVLLVLILVEIVHTVVLSLRAHALAAQPFLVVGLVAVIRKILFALGSQQRLSTQTLALYISMVAVFVAALVAIEVFGRRRSKASDEPGLH